MDMIQQAMIIHNMDMIQQAMIIHNNVTFAYPSDYLQLHYVHAKGN
jgi:hypothetical protein